MTTPLYARGVAKTVALAQETSFGAVSTAPGQLLRRTSSDLNLNIAEIQSQEILPSQQMRDERQGPRQVQGTISGQLSAATYKPFFEGLLRNTFALPAPAGIQTITDGTATVDGNGNLSFTSPTTTFANYFATGDVVRLLGVVGTAAVDNTQNLRVIGFANANSMLLGPAGGVLPISGVQTDGFYTVGKRLIIPATGQLDSSYSIEHWYSDIGRSELFTGCKPTQIAINVPASGFVTMQTSLTGQQMVESGTRVFTGAAAPTTTTGLTATSGEICYNGLTKAYITTMSLQIAAQVDASPVVGSNIVPNIFLGTLSVRGSLTALMTADSLTSDFLNENEVMLSLLLTASPSNSADFVSIHLPRVKLTSSTKNDSDRAITRSYNFVALENTGSAAGNDLTSILIQDSAA